MNFSRRGFLKAVGVGAGAMVGTRLGGFGLEGIARAATPEPTSVVCIFLNGGINAIFTGADAFTNTAFGVTANNATNMGGVVVDNSLASVIPTALRTKVASVGIRHGITDHGNAERSIFMSGNQSAPLMLADAIGGSGAIKAAVMGGNSLPDGVQPNPVNGVSLQPINDMRATIEAITGAQNAPNIADRAGIAKGLTAAQLMSKNGVAKSPLSLASYDPGIKAAVDTVSKPVQVFSAAEFNTAYALNNATAVNSFRTRMAGAELMVRSGAGFVFIQDGGWDTHGDSDGNTVRNMMSQRIAPALGTFLTRMLTGQGATDRNVIVAILGDFHRSLPGSDHQANLAALVMGKGFKNATTGKTDNRVAQPAGTPSIPGFWQLLQTAAKTSTQAFAGANPHAVLA